MSPAVHLPDVCLGDVCAPDVGLPESGSPNPRSLRIVVAPEIARAARL